MSAATQDETLAISQQETTAPPAPKPAAWKWWLTPVAVVIAMLWRGGRSAFLDTLLEVTVITAVCVVVVTRPGFTALTAAAPNAAKRTVTATVGLFLVVQLWGSNTETFPFADWTMYTTPVSDQVVTYRFEGVTTSGDTINFLPSVSNRTLSTKLGNEHLRRLAERVYWLEREPSQTAVFNERSASLTASLQGFATMHNDRSPGAAVHTVIVTRLTFDPASEDLSADSAVQEQLWQLSMEP